AGFRFEFTDYAVTIDALANVKLAPPQIDIIPAQATHLRASQPAEYSGDQEPPRAACCRMDDALDFLRCGDVYANLQFLFVALVGAYLHIERDILGHVAAPPCIA